MPDDARDVGTTPDPMELLLKARCGACAGELGARLNMFLFDRLATWAHPSAGNVLTGEYGRAIGLYCDACVAAGREPQEAVEITDGGELRYHPASGLQPASLPVGGGRA